MRRRSTRSLSMLVAAALAAPPLGAQQVADTAWRPSVARPAHGRGAGPVVYVDEAHNNFHTAAGRFAPFARLLEADGYRVRRFQAPFSRESLDSVRVLVVANAIARQNVGAWRRPVAAAFTEEEMTAVAEWVQGGGSLLLIADHMPMAGAAMELAGKFGVFYVDGFAIDPRNDWDGVTVFRRGDGSLVRHAITDGRSAGERVDSVATFTGSAMTRMVAVDSLFVLPHPTVVMMPQAAWQFSDSTPYLVGSHLLQGAVRTVGRGRVAFFGEAGMFTAQRQNGKPMGLNDPRAAGNAQFILNVLHWLTGLLK
ncbi:MAG TPA: DUF4350 domain-containing protein [Gemmatimonadaceae bacterium]|nr:DUF4350 domain-containing protein [Gemmatimonadaceae bacterium]